jgi:hypothetical protein
MIGFRYWKEGVDPNRQTLQRVQNAGRWSERAHCVVERDLMIGFFMVRRLVELHKVSSKTKKYLITVFSCRPRGRHRLRTDGHDIWEQYDLEKVYRNTTATIASGVFQWLIFDLCFL